ncbi:hypothetical protein WJX84_005916 [Apatococcus fuscideae]|uniref:Peptidase C45 hydrolase domain-containing protein n=1 Tax=Apatococcus fuscideae TaxID=2026836 RepID=A0AAW1SZ90_9CHLO
MVTLGSPRRGHVVDQMRPRLLLALDVNALTPGAAIPEGTPRTRSPWAKPWLDFSDSDAGFQMLEMFVVLNAAKYPEYFQELEGMAAGSGVSMQEIMLLNFRQELSTAGGLARSPPDCSDQLLHGSTNGHALLGHNEDNSGDLLNASYFIQADLGGRQWTAFTYAGELSSTAFGFNDAGVAFTLNALFPTNVTVPGIGRNFVSRDLLQAAGVLPAHGVVKPPDWASSYEDGLRRITTARHSAGHNYNLLALPAASLVQYRSGSGPGCTGEGRMELCSSADAEARLRMATVEVGPGGVHDDLEVLKGHSYFHANSYQRLGVEQMHEESSLHRLKRAAEIAVSAPASLLSSLFLSPALKPALHMHQVPQGADSILKLLGDTEDAAYPLYCRGENGIYTLATALFDLQAATMNVYTGNPKAQRLQASFKLPQPPRLGFTTS